MQSLVAIFISVFELSKDKWRGAVSPHLPIRDPGHPSTDGVRAALAVLGQPSANGPRRAP